MTDVAGVAAVMQGAADLLLKVWPWLPQLFLADFLIVSTLLLWSRRASRNP